MSPDKKRTGILKMSSFASCLHPDPRKKAFFCNRVEQMLNSHYPAHSALMDALSLPGNDLLVLRFIFNHCILIVCYLVYLCCSYLIMRTGGIVRACMCVRVCGCGAETWNDIVCTNTLAHTHHACGWLVCFVPVVLSKGNWEPLLISNQSSCTWTTWLACGLTVWGW